MHPAAVAALRCPHCGSALHLADRALVCDAGHRFDLARQGYVNLVGGAGTRHHGDDSAMVARRERVLAAGLFDPLLDALASAADAVLSGTETGRPKVLIDVGAGPGVHLARLVGDHADRCGIAIDVSKHAARQATRVHRRVVSIVADVWAGLPVSDAVADVGIVAFAPRNGAELARMLAPHGRLIVVVPTAEHLAGLSARFGMLRVDDAKDDRLHAQLAPNLTVTGRHHVTWQRALTPAEAADLAGMGPSARHLDPDAIAAEFNDPAAEMTMYGSVRLLTLARTRQGPRP